MSVRRSDLLVSAAELAQELASDAPPIVLDVRWRLDRPDGWDDYLAGHISRAAFVRFEAELSDPFHPATAGRHPLPSHEDFENSVRGWGVSQDSRVVVYDDSGGLAAARAWWLLRYSGFEAVRVLDGGLPAWISAGQPLDTSVQVPERGDVVLKTGRMPTIDIDGAAAFPAHGVLLDCRARERFRGEVEPIDPAAGHIPGARSAPTTQLLDRGGAFLSVDDIREHFVDLGVGGDVAVYCGSGVTAAHSALALTLAGFTPALYPGSWSQWSNDPDRPVAVGD
jgi:thiosulfate/3-mercaptopyruvate sulfurtransferase